MLNHESGRELIRDNYSRVVDRIGKVARESGRNPDEIRLVVVTKMHPIEVIQAAIDAGATDLGENYVEEAIPKIQALKNIPRLNWHMIGHVQSRKAQSVCEFFQYVHSVDSIKLAERLSRFAIIYNKPLPVWMEFNVSGEQSKSGWDISRNDDWDNIHSELKQIFPLPGLLFLGIMTVPPYSTNPEDSRPYYRQLRKFQEYSIKKLNLVGFTELSMGMSADFEVAIQEGSTCVRIGQAILGPRAG